MDRITKSYMNDFCTSHGIGGEEYVKYEHFINYIIIEQYCYDRFAIEEVNIGDDGTVGIDGFAILINGILVDTKENLTDILQSHKDPEAQVVFIQNKTSQKFEIKDIGNFGWAVADFISETPTIKWNDKVLEKIELFGALIEKSSQLKDKPTCHLYYATSANKTENALRDSKKNSIISDIENENVFQEHVEFEFFGASEVQKTYKRIGKKYKAKFEFPNKVILPAVGEQIPKSYLGTIPAKTLVEIISDENGEIISGIFYDNVRDYQGGNKVNSEIANTLRSENKNMFFAMNNGVTIISEEIHDSRDSVEIEGYQIINGCQTSNVIFENKDELTDDVYVPIRLISTSDENVMSKIIRATNRQTEVKEQDLIAFTDFQKTLEDYYLSSTQPHKLYYERRAKQFNKSNIEKKRIVDKNIQIKAFTSFFYERPDMATRYFGTLFNLFEGNLFKKNHSYAAYYMVSYLLFIIDESIRKGHVNRKYKKIKYFILMMLKYELRRILSVESEPELDAKKFDAGYCNKVLEKAYNHSEMYQLISEIAGKVDELGFNIDDRDIGKSKSFKESCLNLYS
jgi:hypothetical protein